MRKLARYWLTFIGSAWALAASATIIFWWTVLEFDSANIGVSIWFWVFPLIVMAAVMLGFGLWLWRIDRSNRREKPVVSAPAKRDPYRDCAVMLAGFFGSRKSLFTAGGIASFIAFLHLWTWLDDSTDMAAFDRWIRWQTIGIVLFASGFVLRYFRPNAGAK